MSALETNRARYSLYPRDRPLPEIHPAHFAPYADPEALPRGSLDRIGMPRAPRRTQNPSEQHSSSVPPPKDRRARPEREPSEHRRPQQPEPAAIRPREPTKQLKQQYQKRSSSMPPPRSREPPTAPPTAPPMVIPLPYETEKLDFHIITHHIPAIATPFDRKTPDPASPHLHIRPDTFDHLRPDIDIDAPHVRRHVPHPSELADPRWKNGLCGMDALCFEALFCPCMVYGKTQYRLERKSKQKDATEMLGYSRIDGSCMVMTLGCGFQWLFTFIQRTRVRKAYALEGSIGSDCAKSLCCCCCTLAQNEREMRQREQLLRKYAAPSMSNMPYVSPKEGMRYAAPPM